MTVKYANLDSLTVIRCYNIFPTPSYFTLNKKLNLHFIILHAKI